MVSFIENTHTHTHTHKHIKYYNFLLQIFLFSNCYMIVSLFASYISSKV